MAATSALWLSCKPGVASDSAMLNHLSLRFLFQIPVGNSLGLVIRFLPAILPPEIPGSGQYSHKQAFIEHLLFGFQYQGDKDGWNVPSLFGHTCRKTDASG